MKQIVFARAVFRVEHAPHVDVASSAGPRYKRILTEFRPCGQVVEDRKGVFGPNDLAHILPVFVAPGQTLDEPLRIPNRADPATARSE